MRILAIDCAAARCHVAVTEGGRLCAERQYGMDRGQDRVLIPMIEEIMAEARWAYTDLDRIAVLRGPGSFTGLRIGLAAARAIGLVAQRPVVGIDRFCLYRRGVITGACLVLIDSKREEHYAQFFDHQGHALPPVLLTVAEIDSYVSARGIDRKDCAVVGDVQCVALPHPEAEVITLAVLASEATIDDPLYRPIPLYVRPPDITFRADRLHIRAMGGDDVAAAADIHGASFPEPSVWTCAQIEGSLSLQTTIAYGAWLNDTLVGFVLAQSGGGEGEILTLATLPFLRRHGIAQRLMTQVLKTHVDRDGQSMILDVAEDNKAAIALYEKVGFAACGRRKAYYPRPSGMVDAIVYRRICGVDAGFASVDRP